MYRGEIGKTMFMKRGKGGRKCIGIATKRQLKDHVLIYGGLKPAHHDKK